MNGTVNGHFGRHVSDSYVSDCFFFKVIRFGFAHFVGSTTNSKTYKI